MTQKLWLTVREAAPLLGRKPSAIYEQIRLGIFPFEFRRAGVAILISAQDLGLIPEIGLANKEAQQQVENFEVAA